MKKPICRDGSLAKASRSEICARARKIEDELATGMLSRYDRKEYSTFLMEVEALNAFTELTEKLCPVKKRGKHKNG